MCQGRSRAAREPEEQHLSQHSSSGPIMDDFKRGVPPISLHKRLQRERESVHSERSAHSSPQPVHPAGSPRQLGTSPAQWPCRMASSARPSPPELGWLADAAPAAVAGSEGAASTAKPARGVPTGGGAPKAARNFGFALSRRKVPPEAQKVTEGLCDRAGTSLIWVGTTTTCRWSSFSGSTEMRCTRQTAAVKTHRCSTK